MSRLTRSDIHKLLVQPLAKRIDQEAMERWAASLWTLSRKARRDDKKRDKQKPFCIMFPPPNITGNLHLGHALTGAVQDALVRQRQMEGYSCRFIPGFDHAGLATQGIVEKILWKQERISKQELGREKFIDLTNKWKETKLTEMRAQLDRLGLDLDGDREYFTMDENSSHAVRAAFKQLFNEKLIYRANKLIFWCDSLQTTLSDIEVEQVDGKHRYNRTGETVERRPFSQWFVNAQAMAERAVEAVNNGSMAMIPQNYKRSWSAWLLENGVQDWCISRQSWWGHRIPAYKVHSTSDVTESWVVADSIEQAQSKLGCTDHVEQDPDVLDTWFSSSLLPLTISGWPDNDKFHENCQTGFYPLHIMETGFDILTYWVSKMAMISLALTGQIPFKLVLLHGMICDSDGKKMSKSLGNVIDPLDVIDGASLSKLQARTVDAHSLGILEDGKLQIVLDKQKKLFPRGIPACGSDGLRCYLLSHDVHEEVVRVQVGQIDKIRRFTNKVWNVFRFFFTTIDINSQTQLAFQMDVSQLDKLELDSQDQQVLQEMARCVEVAHQSFHDTYQLQHCFVRLENFIAKCLSQDYLMQVRDASISSDVRARKLEILATCLVTSIKILHPYMPHLSEFLYQKLMLSAQSPKGQLDNETDKIRLISREPFPDRSHWAKFSAGSLTT